MGQGLPGYPRVPGLPLGEGKVEGDKGLGCDISSSNGITTKDDIFLERKSDHEGGGALVSKEREEGAFRWY